MSFVMRVLVPVDSAPDNALIYYDEANNEYYLLTDSSGNFLTWDSA
jgi:hypothetical protein